MHITAHLLIILSTISNMSCMELWKTHLGEWITFINQKDSGDTQVSKTSFGFIGHKYGTFQKFKGENGIRAIKCIRSESFKAS